MCRLGACVGVARSTRLTFPVVALAGETRDLLAAKLGAGPFARICGQLEAQAAGRRAERKAATAVQVRAARFRPTADLVQAVNDPAAHARQKMHKQKRRRDNDASSSGRGKKRRVKS